MKKLNLLLLLAFIFLSAIKLKADTGYLYQAAFDGTNYTFGYMSIAKIPVKYAPDDMDWNRWSMLYDGSVYRLYFMPVGKSDKLYQFGFNAETEAYEYGYQSIPEIPVTNLPSNTDVSSFSMLHDGEHYRLYFFSSTRTNLLLQCAYNPDGGTEGVYEYGFNSIPKIGIQNAPESTYWNGWGMLHDGAEYRLYAFTSEYRSALYQFGFDGEQYTYGHASIPTIPISGMPYEANVEKFSMLYDGSYYRFYVLQKPKFK